MSANGKEWFEIGDIFVSGDGWEGGGWKIGRGRGIRDERRGGGERMEWGGRE